MRYSRSLINSKCSVLTNLSGLMLNISCLVEPCPFNNMPLPTKVSPPVTVISNGALCPNFKSVFSSLTSRTSTLMVLAVMVFSTDKLPLTVPTVRFLISTLESFIVSCCELASSLIPVLAKLTMVPPIKWSPVRLRLSILVCRLSRSTGPLACVTREFRLEPKYARALSRLFSAIVVYLS